MTVKEFLKCMRVNDRVEIKQEGFTVWSGYVKNTSILEPFCNKDREFGTRLTIEDSIKIDDSFKIDKDVTVGEVLYNYMSDTTMIRIVKTSGEFLENEEFVYEEYVGDLLNERVVGVDCFIYGADEAGIIIFI